MRDEAIDRIIEALGIGRDRDRKHTKAPKSGTILHLHAKPHWLTGQTIGVTLEGRLQQVTVLGWYERILYDVWRYGEWTHGARVAINRDPPDDDIIVGRTDQGIWMLHRTDLPSGPECIVPGCDEPINLTRTKSGLCSYHAHLKAKYEYRDRQRLTEPSSDQPCLGHADESV